jgi:hypothetical protein
MRGLPKLMVTDHINPARGLFRALPLQTEQGAMQVSRLTGSVCRAST